MCIYVLSARLADFRHYDHLKHPQNQYSMERACHNLSKTPSHALIDAVVGAYHHFENTTRALPDPIPVRRPNHKASSGGGGPGTPPAPDEVLARGSGPVWTGNRTRGALRVMVRATYCINQGVRRRFGKLMARPFDRVWVLRVFEVIIVPKIGEPC